MGKIIMGNFDFLTTGGGGGAGGTTELGVGEIG